MASHHSGVTNGYNWGNTENAEAIRKALEDVNAELDAGAPPVRFDGKMTVLKQPKVHHRPRSFGSTTAKQHETKAGETKESASAAPIGCGIVSLASMKSSSGGYSSPPPPSPVAAESPPSPHVLELPTNYDELYPSHIGMHDALAYMEAMEQCGALDRCIDNKGGGGMSSADTVAQNVSISALWKGHTALLIIEHRKVFRTYKISRDLGTKKKTIEVYTGFLPGTYMTAHEKSKAHFETYCAKEKVAFEAATSVPYEGAAGDASDAKLPSPPEEHTTTDKKLLDELLATDAPSELPPGSPSSTTYV